MNGPTQGLTCPKCGGEMRSYERNGVTVDQCGECRGIFLDRGELEHLIDAENAHYERESSREREQPQRHEDHGGDRPRKKSKKRSFLENLMEMGE
ncbi:MAG TPA: zf-TFIIB domain-containing protein [Solirubrobacterales bacterium]|nr:zf-TFIIB domain-containing protein [Solirubrobacterales bacterium]